MKFANALHNTWILWQYRTVYKVLRGFFRALVLRKNTLKTIELFPSFKCPLKCSMCSVEKYKPVTLGRVMELDDYRRLADEANKMGAIAINVLGGEPFAYPHLDELISTFSKKGFFMDVVTSGVLLTKKRLEALKKAGLNMIIFSIESMDRDKADSIRGEGSFDKVFDGIKLVKEVGLKVGIAPVFFSGKLDEGEDVVKFCHDNDLIAAGSQVAGVGNAEAADNLLTPQEQNTLRTWMETKYPKLIFDWSLSYFFKQRCPAGKEKIGITCYGDVVGCSVNPISFGNVMQEPLAVIWERMQKFSKFTAAPPVCLSAEDPDYIDNYLAPVRQAETYPVHYKNHPLLTREKEPGLY